MPLSVAITSLAFALVHESQLAHAWGSIAVALFGRSRPHHSPGSTDSVAIGFLHATWATIPLYSPSCIFVTDTSATWKDECGVTVKGRFVKLLLNLTFCWGTMPLTPRQELLAMLARKSFRLGEFKLSSGGTSDYYIDCRTTTLDARRRTLTGRVFLEEIFRHGWEPQAIGGLTMGADPIVVAAAMLSAQQTQSRRPRPDTSPGGADYHLIHGFLVRKAEKATRHWPAHRRFREKGAKVVIVDDVCTTGASTIQAIEAAREFGFEVVGVIALVEREEAKAAPT